MRTHSKPKGKSGLLNQSNGLMRNNADAEWLPQNWGRPEQLEKEVETEKKIKFKNIFSVKPRFIVSGILMLLLLAWAGGAWAQTNDDPEQTVCIGNEPYLVQPTINSIYFWTIIPGTSGNEWSINGTGNSITVDWSIAGVYTLSVVERDALGCLGLPREVVVTVNPDMTAVPASSSPTLCINTAMTSITHTTTDATGMGTATGLPAGVTAAWATNMITISGTPTEAGIFSYTIPLTGGCGNVNAAGTITINPLPTPNIVGSNPVCESVNSTTEIYSTINVPGNTYDWTVVGGTFTGQGTNQIVVTWTIPGLGSVSVDETVSNGCPATNTLNITVQAAPLTSNIYHN